MCLSVLMSVYAKEHPAYLRDCFDSLLYQTIPADEWVIVEDGPLTPELTKTLDEYEQRYPTLIKRVPLSHNVGLGPALAEGLTYCSNDLVARMDTDDISMPDRFELQLVEFERNPDLDICGGQIAEFEGDSSNIVGSRSVPLDHESIRSYQAYRDAFNHMTVMYRKVAVLKAGNYQDAPLMEDTLLWCNMLLTGAQCMNLPDTLVLARVGKDMYDRRGGWDYFKKYQQGRKLVRATGFINSREYYGSLAAQLLVALVPSRVRAAVYKSVLHSSQGAAGNDAGGGAR